MTRWRLNVLGGFILRSTNGAEAALPTRKDRLLLAYLALNGSRHQTRDRLCGLLWADRGEPQARGSLRQSLAVLRDVLGDDAVQTTRSTVTLDSSLVKTDVDQFQALAQGGDATACELYAGELLSGIEAPQEFEQWLKTERLRLEDLAADFVIRLATETSVTPSDGGISLARQLLDRDPLREPVHRALMRLLSKAGDRAAAVRAYTACRDVLEKELGVSPELETEQLYRDILTEGSRGTSVEPPATRTTCAVGDRPSIAVAPFANLSGDPALELLCEGLTEEIITGLGRFRSLVVIDRHSSSMVAKNTADTAEMGKRLGVGLIVQGSVQRQQTGLRITVRLVDAETRSQSWGEYFDCPAEEALSLPEVITRSMIATLYGRVENHLTNQSRRTPVLAAYNAVLLGIKHIRRYGADDNKRALALFQQALEIDPDYALARAYRAFADVVINDYEFAPPGILERARLSVEEAIEMEPDESRCHWLLGIICGCAGDMAGRARSFHKAYALNPNDANFEATFGMHAAADGRPQEGIDHIRRAMRLNPYHPDWYWQDLGDILYMAGRYETALEAYRHRPRPDGSMLARIAACLAHLERSQEAAAIANEVKYRFPDYRRSKESAIYWGTSFDHIQAGLLKAGFD